jgi:DNA-binding MarR family transcriptional regulator
MIINDIKKGETMDKTLSHEFLSVLNKLKKLNHHHHSKTMVHQGEFMMLGAIHGCMNEKKELNQTEPGIKVGELSEIIHSTKPATSKMLKVLEEKGYINRIPDQKDRRVVYICLSPDGDKMIRKAMDMMQNFFNRTISRLGEEDTRELIRLMNRFYDAMIDEINDKPIDESIKSK